MSWHGNKAHPREQWGVRNEGISRGGAAGTRARRNKVYQKGKWNTGSRDQVMINFICHMKGSEPYAITEYLRGTGKGEWWLCILWNSLWQKPTTQGSEKEVNLVGSGGGCNPLVGECSAFAQLQDTSGEPARLERGKQVLLGSCWVGRNLEPPHDAG